MRTEEQVLEQGRQLHQRDEEIKALRVQLAMKSSQLDAALKELAVRQSAMGMMEVDNKALQQKLVEVAEHQEVVVAERSTASVEAYKMSLPCRKLRLEGIKRSWEGLASTLIKGGKVTAAELGEVDHFPCMAVDPTYREKDFDLIDDLIHHVFSLLDGISRG
ncbi:hypothetical protein AXF42_Ash007580 [Apostasia shenzhenica]|uniref:Uncharacterized protein n=1 Tax=Apostasia shenzhenica TaxID=1088818 RepID=A0A2I0A5V3_9ASPA|nr:hypothetical protein AXF42_Ash007580 [Apostasia shenzhenica]